jgi:FixJ family two-component response regulator
MPDLVVHVIDDDGPFRTALTRLLTASGHAVKSFASADELLAARPLEGGCLVLDVDMPGCTGVELQAELNRSGSLLPIIFLTASSDIGTSVRTVKAGAEDFLCKPVDAQTLLAAIDQAFARYRSASASSTTRQQRQALLDRLSTREREVFDLVILGMLNKQIADRLGMTERTVKAHRASIVDKLGMRSVAEMVTLAGELGLLAGNTQ